MPQTFFARVWSFVKGFPGLLVKSRIALIITVLVVLAAGGFVWYHQATKKQVGGYTTTKAALGSIQETVSASGNLIAVQSVALTFKNQGYVQACNVQLGDLVKAGQVLATEQTSDLQDSYNEALDKLDSDQAAYNKLVATKPQELAEAQAAADNAKATVDRDQQLQAAGGISQSTLDTDTLAYKTALYTLAQDQSNADVEADADTLKNDQAALDLAQDNLNNASIVAPFDGYVATIEGNPGMWTGGGAVASGTATATQFEIILTSTQLEIDAYVNEADISKVNVGQPITFTVDTYPNDTFTGKVIALSPNATTVSNVQEYEAHLSIDDYSKLKSGLPATITIITASANNVIVIPQSALSYGKTYLASLARTGFNRQHQGGSNASQQGSQGGASASQGGASQGGNQGGSSASQGGAYQGSYQGGSASQGGSQGSATSNRGVVVVLVNGQPQIKRVTTGLSDSINMQIASGLNAGDIVVTGSATPGKTSTASTTTSTTAGGARAGGGGGFGGAAAIRL